MEVLVQRYANVGVKKDADMVSEGEGTEDNDETLVMNTDADEFMSEKGNQKRKISREGDYGKVFGQRTKKMKKSQR